MTHPFQTKSGLTRIPFAIGLALLLLLLFRLTIKNSIPAHAFEMGEQHANQEWTVIYSESFESDWESAWNVADISSTDGGEYHWSSTKFTATDGDTSLWASGGGDDGHHLSPGADQYPNNSNTSLVQPLNAIDLGNAKQIRLKLDILLQSEKSFDYFKIFIFTENRSRLILFSGGKGEWETKIINLDEFVDAGPISLHIAFQSDEKNVDQGVFIDNIIVETKETRPEIETTAELERIYFESFETSQLNAGWSTTDTSRLDAGEYMWGITDFIASHGTQSAWVAAGGADGKHLRPGTTPYPNHVNTEMVWNYPIPISESTDIRLSFDHFISTEAGWDRFKVHIINDDFSILEEVNLSGKINLWQTQVLPLDHFEPEDSIFLTFIFESDGDIQDLGAFVDNVKIEGIKRNPSPGTQNRSPLFTPLIWRHVSPSPPVICLSTDQEPNNSATTLNIPICMNQIIRGTLSPSADPVDIYLIEQSGDSPLNITLSDIPPNHNYVMTLFDEKGGVVDQNGSANLAKSFAFDLLPAGDYFLLIGFDYGLGSGQAYALRVEN